MNTSDSTSSAEGNPLRIFSEFVQDYAIFMLDPQGNIVSWNPGAELIKGYQADEIIGKHISCFYTEEAIQTGEPEKLIEQAKKEGRSKSEGWRVRKDGSKFWASVVLTALFDHQGNLTGFAKITSDLTEGKNKEEILNAKQVATELQVQARTAELHKLNQELQAAESRQRMLINTISAVVWSLSPTGELSQCTPPWHEFTGLSQEAMQGMGWLDALHPSDRNQAKKRLQESLATLKPYEDEFRVRKADGKTCYLAARGVPLQVEKGNANAWYGLFVDITRQKSSDVLLAAVVDNALDGIIGINAQGIIQSFNLEAEKQFGYKASEVIGTNIKLLMPEPYHSQHDGYLQNYLQTGMAKIIGIGRRVEAQRKDGSVFPIELGVTEFFVDGEPHFTGVVRDITKKVEREEELWLRDRAIQAVSQGILITDPNLPDNPIIYASPGAEKLTGYLAEELVGHNCRMLQGAGTDPETVKLIREAIAAQKECSAEILNYRKDGTPFWNALYISPVRDEQGKLYNFIGVQVDVSERRNLESQIHQSQKMETIGQLAGGVAHDFNNLLSIIIGYCELLKDTLPEEDPNLELIESIFNAGERAAGLTNQLLSFSRRSVIEPKVFDLNTVIRSTEKILGRIIGEDIEMVSILDPQLSRIKADPGLIGQVVMNLAVNARDAMPQGGKLTMETKNLILDEAYVNSHLEVQPGPYVLLMVSDTGIGMTAEVKSHIFEPFFTTKGQGKGTGLGLSVVHGIVKQSNGQIGVYSEPGVGTTFKVYLPAIDDVIRTHRSQPKQKSTSPGKESVLLVEDEAELRKLAFTILKSQGFQVLTAASGQQALEIMQQHPAGVDILVTDVVMPGMSGRQLAELLTAQFPQMKVLYLSGYTDDAIVRHGILQSEVAFLQKPFTPSLLTNKVRQVLAQ